MKSFATGIFSVGLMLSGAVAVSAQDYPSKPIRIVAGSLGSSNDFISRLIAPGLASPLGQQVIVENRGGGSIITGEAVSKAPPDGYTLIVAGNSFWTAPLLQNTPYDVIRDFSPITIVAISTNLLVAHPSLPVRSVKELIALAKARPGELNYSAGGTGGTSHLAVELFKSMAGVNIVNIPYKNPSQALNAVLSGEVQITFDSASPFLPHIKAGRLRALAVTTAKPSAVFPALPTVAASLPGYETTSMNAMFAPARTPAAIINRLNSETVRILNQPDVREKLLTAGYETAGGTPQELAAAVKAEMGRLGKVIKDAGIKAE